VAARKKVDPIDLIVVGSDPSLANLGVCFMDEIGFAVTSKPALELSLVEPIDDHYRIWIETPQNGQHSSRRGVAIATGVLLHALGVTPKQYKKYVHFVEPDEWRRHIFGKPIRDGRAKEHAMRLCAETWPDLDIPDHDAAEALLIACFGWWVETGKRRV
jgi:hypothetical protein